MKYIDIETKKYFSPTQNKFYTLKLSGESGAVTHGCAAEYTLVVREGGMFSSADVILNDLRRYTIPGKGVDYFINGSKLSFKDLDAASRFFDAVNTKLEELYSKTLSYKLLSNYLVIDTDLNIGLYIDPVSGKLYNLELRSTPRGFYLSTIYVDRYGYNNDASTIIFKPFIDKVSDGKKRLEFCKKAGANISASNLEFASFPYCKQPEDVLRVCEYINDELKRKYGSGGCAPEQSYSFDSITLEFE